MTAYQMNQSQSNETATATATAEEQILYKPSEDEIAERAHARFEAGGSQHGNHVEHWLAAESDLLAERTI